MSAATIGNLITMIMIYLFLAFGGYVIIVGDREEARLKKEKQAEKARLQAEKEKKIILPIGMK